jgi:uncharacterized OB-fold protein
MTSAAVQPIRPLADNVSAFFWAGAREHRLMVQQCDDCGQYQHPPRTVCRNCLSYGLTATELSGRGTVYTYTTTVYAFHPYFVERIPYILAVIELAEQPQLKILSNLVDCDEDAAHTGMQVQVVFDKVDDDLTLPVFRPAVNNGVGAQQ